MDNQQFKKGDTVVCVDQDADVMPGARLTVVRHDTGAETVRVERRGWPDGWLAYASRFRKFEDANAAPPAAPAAPAPSNDPDDVLWELNKRLGELGSYDAYRVATALAAYWRI